MLMKSNFALAALIFLTLMLGETQWLWNNTIPTPLQNLRCVCSDYGVHLLTWSRHMQKEMHKIGPLDKAGVLNNIIV